MVAFTTIPMDALPVDEAYWAAARELFPFIDIARPVPVERDRDGKGARRNHKWRKADERTRRALAQLDKRWRLSLAFDAKRISSSTLV
jgi:hypothetical protein